MKIKKYRDIHLIYFQYDKVRPANNVVLLNLIVHAIKFILSSLIYQISINTCD